MNREYECLLLGDSRSAGIEEDALYTLTGKKNNNLAFGGASLNESIDLFWWAIEQQNYSKVIIQMSFYTVNSGYNFDRIKDMESIASNPIRFLVTGSFHIDTIKHFLSLLKKEDKTITQDYSAEERRNNKLKYSKEIIYPILSNYSINYNALEELKKIAAYCKKENIELYFFIPPVDETVWQYVIDPLDLYDEIVEYKTALSYYATVYDLEYKDNTAYSEEDFVDGFHLYHLSHADNEAIKKYPALRKYIDALLNIRTSGIYMWDNGKKVFVEG